MMKAAAAAAQRGNGDDDHPSTTLATPGGLLCYKCGSTEHSLSSCPQRKRRNYNHKKDYGDEALPYATCFVCHQMGHLASQCPQNTKGIYVNGGSCRLCGSQDHLATDCPDNHKKKKRKTDGVDGAIAQDFIGEEDDLLEQDKTVEKTAKDPESKKPKQRRVVKF
jgi:zinc finger CCHC domain-containing protein 9